MRRHMAHLMISAAPNACSDEAAAQLCHCGRGSDPHPMMQGVEWIGACGPAMHAMHLPEGPAHRCGAERHGACPHR